MRKGDDGEVLRYRLTEQPIYGSTRLGVRNLERNAFFANYLFEKKHQLAEPEDPTHPLLVAPAKPQGDLTNPLIPQPEYSLTLGYKQYELTNHLGNVQVTLSDRKLGLVQKENSSFSSYTADVLSAVDYYPFGMAMPGRSGEGGYRYGFNGKENDQETMTQDYGFRIYNPGIARFLSVDPLFKNYSYYTPYQFAGNKPIVAVDLDRLEEFFAMDGSLIGIGNPNDRRKMLVLRTETSKQIQKMNAEERVGFLKSKPFDVIVAPTREFIAKLEEVINKSTDTRWYFGHGLYNGGNFVFSDVYLGINESWGPTQASIN